MINILFTGNDASWDEYAPHLTEAFKQLPFTTNLARDIPPAEVDYIVFGGGEAPITDFTPFTRAKLVQRLWAGVEDIVDNKTLTIPLARMVGGGLDQGMVEWVTGHVLRHHLGMDAHLHGQDGVWRNDVTPPLARDRQVTILGLGALGQACGQALAHLGFPVTGWSRSQKQITGITCLSGQDGLLAALSTAQVLVLLLPKTPATENTLNHETIARLPKGAVVLNPGRGGLIDDQALLDALDRGHLAHATLDTFRTEPLPADDPFWAHPKVTVTPHIASATRADLAAEVVATNIKRGEAGEEFLHLVDRTAGY
ncbi:2-hydroxyacid dehydrogenase [Loktanella sp. S4079]|uniref:2-hydroxyacid dehydrogenase n=1 Tax=Loktanella sp. S4079 TaxID=579483 RepID=UPI0005FA3298|nr:glyoxylate/hydroxypyruvate reductase A [Loktanella sp. S4079]KJZ18347.1 hydroxyacid dehydrogenase [Loktanella sp. S4079]